MTLFAKIARKISGNIPVKIFRLKLDRPIVSFSFDDVPKTAVTLGSSILDNHDVAGTFYVCGGLTDKIEANMMCHSEQDLLDLIDRGHEIASHLFHHTNCADLSAENLKKEILLNNHFFSALQKDRNLINFSYPFGGTTLLSRFIMAKQYATSRGIRPGINHGIVDLSNLYANSIYSKNTNETNILDVLQETKKKNGWTIFYTHDVAEIPSEWGTHPELLEFAVKKSVELGCDVLPIRNAIGKVGFR